MRRNDAWWFEGQFTLPGSPGKLRRKYELNTELKGEQLRGDFTHFTSSGADWIRGVAQGQRGRVGASAPSGLAAVPCESQCRSACANHVSSVRCAEDFCPSMETDITTCGPILGTYRPPPELRQAAALALRSDGFAPATNKKYCTRAAKHLPRRMALLRRPRRGQGRHRGQRLLDQREGGSTTMVGKHRRPRSMDDRHLPPNHERLQHGGLAQRRRYDPRWHPHQRIQAEVRT